MQQEKKRTLKRRCGREEIKASGFLKNVSAFK
jgi:hypothetical protein